jgi:hypothetical protein
LWYAAVVLPVTLARSTVLVFAALLVADLVCCAGYFLCARRSARADFAEEEARRPMR